MFVKFNTLMQKGLSAVEIQKLIDEFDLKYRKGTQRMKLLIQLQTTKFDV